MVGGRFQVPRFQTEVRHVKVFGWNVTVDVAVEHKKLYKGLFHPDTQRRGGKGPLSWGGTTFRSAGAKQKHNFEHFIE